MAGGIISALGSPGLGALMSCPQIPPGGSQGSDGLGVRVPPPVNKRGIPGPARAQDEDLEGGHRESHRSQHLQQECLLPTLTLCWREQGRGWTRKLVSSAGVHVWGHSPSVT